MTLGAIGAHGGRSLTSADDFRQWPMFARKTPTVVLANNRANGLAQSQ